MSVSRVQIKQLIQRREEMEKEMEQIIKSLDQSGVGLHGALVDSQGFPRNDLDLNMIRTLRHQYACLQTDYKELMQSIESSMNQLFEQEKSSSTISSGNNSTSNTIYNESVHGTAFLLVSDVAPHSPASQAGLQKQDQILQFGTLAKDQLQNNLKLLSQYVEHHLQQSIAVKVKRQDSVITLQLIPQSWSGRGYLGCLLAPL